MIGNLSTYIEALAAKRLSSVEAYLDVSRQHEFNGVGSLKRLFGENRQKFSTRFIYLGGDESESVSADGWMTWYDAREKHETRSEHRLYYSSTAVSESMDEGDLLVIARLANGSLVVIVAASNSTAENQVKWLFGLTGDLSAFSVKNIEGEDDVSLGVASRLILEEIGFAIEETDESYLACLLERFDGTFPTTREFSMFARETLPEVSSLDDPDAALLAWYDREEILFRTLESHIVSQRLSDGFNDDVDAFIQFSLSVHNRRKSRAGFALENHIEQVFIDFELRYSRGQITEGRAKPDFVFPDIVDYQNPEFPTQKLTMLGAKTSAKDRWRQVLPEANRIRDKHLLTLEPGISLGQMAEMKDHHLQLVVPAALHETYLDSQRSWLLNLSGFIGIVRERCSRT